MDTRLRRELMARLNGDAAVIAARFGLRYRVIEPERPRVKRRYGVCFSDGTIRIRLAHAKTGEPLRYSSLVATLCHELAHLRHFNHGQRFRAFNQTLLEWARSRGIYRPRSPRRAQLEPIVEPCAPRPIESPRQLSLFG
ncbi:MAG: M48 family metallopeptidase [Myxococcota bacterium]